MTVLSERQEKPEGVATSLVIKETEVADFQNVAGADNVVVQGSILSRRDGSEIHLSQGHISIQVTASDYEGLGRIIATAQSQGRKRR